MSPYDPHKVESDLRTFTLRNFERPTDSKDLEQVRFYVRELCLKIEALESKFDYVPMGVYTLSSI